MSTMRDVATEVGCSTATVSRALSGNPHVDEAMRTRVKEAAARLGYEIHGVARALRQRDSRTVGLVVPTLDMFNHASSVLMLHDVLSGEGYRLILCCHRDDPDYEADAIRSLLERQVEAIVHIPCDPGGAEAILGRRSSIPVIELYRRSRSASCDAVVADDHLGSREVARYLVGLGHERIAMVVSDDQYSTTVSRISGFRGALAEAGIAEARCPVLAGSGGTDWGEAAVDKVLEEHPDVTAIFGVGSPILLGVLRGLKARHLSIPKQISVVGLSNADWCDIVTPAVTSYENPREEMGLTAAQLLMGRLRPPERLALPAVGDMKRRVVTLSGELVVRRSAAEPRRPSDDVGKAALAGVT